MKNALFILFALFFSSLGLSQNSDCNLVVPTIFEKEKDEFSNTQTVWRLNFTCTPEKIHVQLINRFGKTVVEKEAFAIEEELVIDGTGIKPQTLFYSIEIIHNGEKENHKGTVQIANVN